jgi:hypothetical protein
MRVVASAAATAAALVLVVGSAVAGAPNGRVTGGGQNMLGSTGPGNTIAFEAHQSGSGNAATGQVQFIDRSAGTGQDQVKFHAQVECLIFDSANSAQMYGHDRDGNPFELYVMDNGEGALASGMDIAAINRTPSGDCQNPNNNDKGSSQLYRGNAQVYQPQ